MQNFGGTPASPPQHPQGADSPQALSATVHELSESVNAIATYVETARRLLARQTTQPDDKVVGILGKAAAQATRATEVFRQLRALIRGLEEGHGMDGRDFSTGAAERDHAAEEPTTTRCGPH